MNADHYDWHRQEAIRYVDAALERAELDEISERVQGEAEEEATMDYDDSDIEAMTMPLMPSMPSISVGWGMPEMYLGAASVHAALALAAATG